MLVNWLKTFVLMAAITALFGTIGAFIEGGRDGASVGGGRHDEYLCVLVLR
jgi:hypothetical protein